MSNKLKGSFLSPYKIVKPFFEKQQPITLEVHPEYRCNYNCEWCIDRVLKEIGTNKDSTSSLSEEGVRSIIDSCIKLGIKGIVISGGGEPTLNKNTELLVELSDENDIVIGMFTNGSLLTDETIKTYIEHLSFLRFSFDDFSSEHYALTKGVPERNYNLVLNNIRKCVQYKKENKTKCRLGIDFILTPTNIERMEEIYKEVKDLDVDYLQFCDCVIIGYEFTERRKEDIRLGLDKVIACKVKDENTMDVVYEPIQMENKVYCKDCYVKDYIVAIGAEGDVMPCPHTTRFTEMLYGNIFESSLHEVWENRPKVLNSDKLYENCRFRKQNEILQGLANISHGEMV